MAFFSMMLVYGAILFIFLGGVSLIGIAIIVFSVNRRQQDKIDGIKPEKSGLIAGLIITVLPILISLKLIIETFFVGDL